MQACPASWASGLGRVGPAFWDAAAGGVASIPGDSRRSAPRRLHSRRSAFPHSLECAWILCFELANPDHGAARRCGFTGRRSAWFPLLSTTAICLGFVDGTENPRGKAAIDAVLIGAEDAAFAGGSYVIVQKYLHDLAGGMRCPRKRRNASSAAPNCPTSNWTIPSNRPRRITRSPRSSRTGKRSRSCATTCHSARPGRRIRHLFHRLQPFAAHDRTDARKHVRRPSARQLRPPARFQPRCHRQPVLRPVRDVSGDVQPTSRRCRNVQSGQAPNHHHQSRRADGSLRIGSLKGDIQHE